jgi:DNA-binding CsgD family transcriptional regulator
METKQSPLHTPVPASGVRLPAVDSEPPVPVQLVESSHPPEEAHEGRADDEVLTPRIVTFSVDDAVLAVVKVPLIERSPLSKLTPVERHVASLAARGLSNAAIGRQRGKSERTVANQMASILRKLSVGSRYELAALLAPCDLELEQQAAGPQSVPQGGSAESSGSGQP